MEGGNEGGIEPVLVEEGVKWFENLYDDAEAIIESELQRISVVIHAFMLELGFSVENAKVVPENWKSPAGYISRYSYNQSSEFDVILTVTSLGPFLKSHGCHTSSKSSFSSSKIKMDDFLVEKEGKIRLKNIRHLARLFKNEVGVPLLNSVRSHLGLPTSGLEGMPPEISLKMLKIMDLKTLVRMSAVCKQFNAISKEKCIWKHIFIRDFGSRSYKIKEFQNRLNNENEDWFSLYKEEYLNKKEREESRSRVPPPPLFPFPDFENNPQNPLMPPMPGIVGGDYDRIPFGRDPLRNPLNLPRPRFDPPGPGFGQGRRGGDGGFGPPGFGGGGFL